METVCEIAVKSGSVPNEKSKFIELAEKFASPIIKKRDRLGGWTTANTVWGGWNALIDPSSMEQP